MLRCIKDFNQYERNYKAGDVIVAPAHTEEWLLDSFPAHFERIEAPAVEPVEVVTADIEQPPADKAIKRPRGRK